MTAPTWVKSRRCDTNACTEVGDAGDRVYVRNSLDPDGPMISFTKEEWNLFLEDLHGGALRFPD